LPLPWSVVLSQSGEIADTQAAYRLLMQAAEQAKAPWLAIDTFTRPDVVGLGSTENGITWELLAGGFSVTSLKATSTTSATVVANVGMADMDVTATIVPTTGAPGIAFRSDTTNSDRMSIQIDVTNSLFNLQKTVAGTTTSLGSASQAITPGAAYIVRVTAIGNSVTCYLDGGPSPGVTLAPLTYTLTAPEQTQFGVLTRAGLRNTGQAAFDNFRVAPAYPTATSSAVTLANLPAGVVLAAPESGGAYTRPTSRSDLYVIFPGTSNPGAASLADWDFWFQTP
jgi:hypothetical protein